MSQYRPTGSRGLYRDRENGWIFGVCAGLADRFDIPVSAARAVAVVALLIAFWFTGLVYLMATLILRDKPLIYSGRDSEDAFWRRYRHDHWRHS